MWRTHMLRELVEEDQSSQLKKYNRLRFVIVEVEAVVDTLFLMVFVIS